MSKNGMSRTHKEFLEDFKNNNYDLFKQCNKFLNKYKNSNTKMRIITKFGVVNIIANTLARKKNSIKSFGICSAENKTEWFINESNKIHNNKYDYSKTKYINHKTKVIIICPIHGEFYQSPINHKNSGGCPKCGNYKISIKKITPNGNSIRDVRPDLIKYLKYESDADKFTYGSNHIVKLICPNCGNEKDVIVSNLSSQGFYCNICSDGISIPEKFGINLLKQLNVDFETQKSFKWSNKKRYDFYIPSINLIIESHGIQHYIESPRGQSLNKEIANDKIKYELAINNRIKLEDYIIVDCRKSNLEYLKKEYSNQLKPFFNLDFINWNLIWLKCHKSIVFEIWEAWNKRNKDETIVIIANKFKLSSVTIRNYLKNGNKFGKCKYDSEKEMNKEVFQYSLEGAFIKRWKSMSNVGRNLNISASNISLCCKKLGRISHGSQWSCKKYDSLPPIIRSKKVYQYSLDNIFIKEWISAKIAGEDLNVNITSIHACCNNKRKTCGGYIWKHYNK